LIRFANCSSTSTKLVVAALRLRRVLQTRGVTWSVPNCTVSSMRRRN